MTISSDTMGNIFFNIFEDGEIVVNFHRLLGSTDDSGFEKTEHIGFLKYKEIPDTEKIEKDFKEKWPEEIL